MTDERVAQISGKLHELTEALTTALRQAHKLGLKVEFDAEGVPTLATIGGRTVESDTIVSVRVRVFYPLPHAGWQGRQAGEKTEE